MILFIYYKLKHIFGMFCNKVYFMFDSVKRSSLFYKTSARHTWHKNASATWGTQVWHEWDKSDKSTTGVQQQEHECNSGTSVKRVERECDTKKIDFLNGMLDIRGFLSQLTNL